MLPSDRDLGPANALDPGDRADRDAVDLQNGPLLDVEFDEGVRHLPGQWRCAEVADAVEFFAQHGTVDPDDGVGFFYPHTAGVDEAAEHVGREASALLVGEERDGQITGGRDPRRLQSFDHFESGKHAKVAVIAAAGADRVDVCSRSSPAGHRLRHPSPRPRCRSRRS